MLELPGPTISLDHFETMLEYCYTGKIAFHEGNTIAMLYFGETLQIRALKENATTSLVQSIREFTKNPHNTDTEKSELLAAYYLEAKCLSRSNTTSSSSSTFQEQEQAKTKASSTITVMQELRTAIVDRCAGQPRWVAKNTALFTMHDPKFWWKVWKARKKYKKETVAATKLWSTNLAYFLQATTTTTMNQHPPEHPEHPTIIDRDFFAFLTHIDSLPVVSAEASVMLMDYEQQLLALYDDDGKIMIHGNNNSNNNATELTCLQKRCTKALYNQKTRDWEITNDTRLLLEGHLRNLPPALLEALLLRAMEPAAVTTTTTTTTTINNDNNNNNNNNNNSGDGDTRVPFTTLSSTTKLTKSAASFVEEINDEIEVVSRRKNNNNIYDARSDNNTRGLPSWTSSKHTTKQTKTKKKSSSFVSSKSRRDGKKNVVETVNDETTNNDENNNSHIANTTVSTNIGGSSWYNERFPFGKSSATPKTSNSSKNNGGDAEKSKITASVSFLGDISIIDFDIDTVNMITSIPNYLPPPTSTRSNGTTTAVYSFMNEID